MREVQSWVEATFAGPEQKVFFELGAHDGEDTVWLAAIAGVTVHAFEPDPRNNVPALPNVVFTRAAIFAVDGVAPFWPSKSYGTRFPVWTESGSLRRPTGHLRRWPDVTFGEPIDVRTVALDTYMREQALERVDFIWADIQGCEGDMIEGGRETLRRTRYLYTEIGEQEYYAGQKTTVQLLEMLPDWRVVKQYGENLLLENVALAPAI